MTNVKMIIAQHPKNVGVIVQITKGRLKPFEKVGRMI
jgi:hypothetical protein